VQARPPAPRCGKTYQTPRRVFVTVAPDPRTVGLLASRNNLVNNLIAGQLLTTPSPASRPRWHKALHRHPLAALRCPSANDETGLDEKEGPEPETRAIMADPRPGLRRALGKRLLKKHWPAVSPLPLAGLLERVTDRPPPHASPKTSPFPTPRFPPARVFFLTLVLLCRKGSAAVWTGSKRPRLGRSLALPKEGPTTRFSTEHSRFLSLSRQE